MKISPTGLAMVKKLEGYLEPTGDGGCKAYRCPAGKWTCGWGCTESVTSATVWTKEQAEAALAAELDKHAAIVESLVTVPLTEGQADALISFNFNAGKLASSTLLKKLNAGDYDGAAAEFGRWNKYTDPDTGELKEAKGLTARRAKEAALFAEVGTAMPQAVAEPKTYTAKDLQATSSKFSLATWLQRLFGTAGVTTLGLVSSPDLGQSVSAISVAAKTFKDVGPWGLAIGFLVLVLLLEVFRAKTQDDANSGRYTPSGETKTTKKDATA